MEIKRDRNLNKSTRMPMRHRNIGIKTSRILSEVDKLIEIAGNDISVGVGKVKVRPCAGAIVETAARTICNCLTLIKRAIRATINRMFKTIRMEDVIVRIEVLEDTENRSRN